MTDFAKSLKALGFCEEPLPIPDSKKLNVHICMFVCTMPPVALQRGLVWASHQTPGDVTHHVWSLLEPDDHLAALRYFS